MIKPLNALRLAKSKFHTKRRLTILSLITSGLLFGVLIAIIIVTGGVVASLNHFVEEVGGKHYQVSIKANLPLGKIIQKYSDPSHQTIDAVRQYEVKYRADKAKQYRAQGLKYDPSEDASALQPDKFAGKSEPAKYQVKIDYTSPITRQIFSDEYAKWSKTATNKTSNLMTVAKKYGATGYHPSRNDLAFFYKLYGTKLIADDKEDLRGWVDTLAYSNNPIEGSRYYGANDKLTDKYITYRDKLKGVPVVLSASDIAEAFGKKLGVSQHPPADGQAKIDWLKQVRRKASGFTYQVCYRNEVEQEILTKIQQVQNESAASDTGGSQSTGAPAKPASSDSSSKPKPNTKLSTLTDGEGLYYRLPTTPCGDIIITADKRTAEQKTDQYKQNLVKQRQGKPILPQHRLVTMQIVGVSNESNQQADSSKNLLDIGKSVLAPQPFFGETSLIPLKLYRALPNQLKIDDIPTTAISSDLASVDDMPEGLAKQFPYGILEFNTAEQARRFLEKETVSEQRANDSNKPYVAEQYGVNFLVLDDLTKQLEQVITITTIVVAGLAVIIIWTTISRIISESRQETAVYRAIGAKRRDIALIYLNYALILALLTIIIAGVIGVGITLTLDSLFAGKLTAIAQTSVSIIGGSSQIRLFAIDNQVIAKLALVDLGIIVVTLIAGIQPIISNTHRSPASDLRAE